MDNIKPTKTLLLRPVGLPKFDTVEFKQIFGAGNRDLYEQNEALVKLLDMPTEEVAFLPFFEGACETYHQLIVSSLFGVMQFKDETIHTQNLIAAAFATLVRIRQINHLPATTNEFINGLMAAWNEKKLFNNLTLSNPFAINFREADLSNLDLTGSDLKNINLSYCNLSNTNLTDTDLTGTNLKNTIFTDGTLVTNAKGINVHHASRRNCIIS